MWEIYTLRDPAAFLPADPTGRAVASATHSGMRLPLPPAASAGPTALVTACWAADPATRPTFGEVCAMLDGTAPTRSVGEMTV